MHSPLAGGVSGDVTSGADVPVAADVPASVDAPAAADAASGGEVPADGAVAQRPILRLHIRRRRHRTHAPGLLPGPVEPASEGAAPTPTGADATGGGAAPGAAPLGRFRAPRRRRRQAPLAAAPAVGDAGEPATEGAPPGAAGQPTSRPPRSRNRRRRAAPAGEAAGEAREHSPRQSDRAGPAGPRGRGGEQRRQAGERSGPGEAPRQEARDAGSRDNRRGAGPRDRRDGPPGRGRRDGPRPVERKLYSIDAVVDRGFEDVEEEEAETRRVHWTIVKRTTADQLSRKALSAVYVLQRDGSDTEFPSLGAARDAVNKKIVHPEKLTLSKAEHAAAKK